MLLAYPIANKKKISKHNRSHPAVRDGMCQWIIKQKQQNNELNIHVYMLVKFTIVIVFSFFQIFLMTSGNCLLLNYSLQMILQVRI